MRRSGKFARLRAATAYVSPISGHFLVDVRASQHHCDSRAVQ